MTLPVLIIGAGGHARVLIEAVLASGTPIAGIVDIDPVLKGKIVQGVPVLGGDAVVDNFPSGEFRLVNGIGSIRDTRRRRELFERFSARGYFFATVVHPAAVVASDAVLYEGAQIMAGAIIQPGCRIGQNSIINTKASADHDCQIGAHVHVAPGVTLSGDVRIGDHAHVGTGATVIQGVVIGAGSLVAAGAVVVRDVAAGAWVMGLPAKEVLS